MVLAGSYTWQIFKIKSRIETIAPEKPITQPLSERSHLIPNFFRFVLIMMSPTPARLPEYFRADASAIYNFSLGSGFKATAGISVLNFTNRNNILNAYYQLDDDDTIEKIENVSLGLTPNVSFRVRVLKYNNCSYILCGTSIPQQFKSRFYNLTNFSRKGDA